MKTYKIKSILVPFDFSHSALNALKVADKFALEFNSKVYLINIIEPFTACDQYGFTLNQYNDYVKESTLSIERYLLQNSFNPYAYCYEVRFGFCTTTITSMVKDKKYDLIVVPDETKNCFSRIVSKYNPLKIMESTNIPVIAVNKYYRIVDFRNIILPIRNVSNWYDKLPFMISLVQQTGGKIHAVGIDELNDTTTNQFRIVFDHAVAILEQENVLNTVNKFKGESSLANLKLFSQVQKADLIAITPPQKIKTIRSIFNPSLYSRLIYDSPAPVFGVKLG